jgi:hypothetical protein
MVNQTHGLRKLKDAIHEVAGRGLKVVDGRTAIGKALMRWRGEIEQDLGGAESLSAQQHTVLDICMRQKLLLDSVDHWLVRQPRIIDSRKRSVYPVVVQRQALADGLVKHLVTLGLGRKAKHVQSLSDYLAARSEPSETVKKEAVT